MLLHRCIQSILCCLRQLLSVLQASHAWVRLDSRAHKFNLVCQIWCILNTGSSIMDDFLLNLDRFLRLVCETEHALFIQTEHLRLLLETCIVAGHTWGIDIICYGDRGIRLVLNVKLFLVNCCLYLHVAIVERGTDSTAQLERLEIA